ncbi:cyclin-J-like isoform X2 [Palaemon carinicauda]
MSRGNILVTDYAEEVLKWMKKTESESIPWKGNSPQLNVRLYLVDLIRIVCETLKLNVLTTHLAVYLLDRFMETHRISKQQLKLASLTTILIAAKFEEAEEKIPSITDLNSLVNNKYSLKLFNSMEQYILKSFNWNVGKVTAAHFAEFYLTRGIIVGDTMKGITITNKLQASKLLWKETLDFLDRSIQDYLFLQWPSTQVAAACLACGRVNCDILPTWPLPLETTTGYTLQMLSQIMDELFRIYEKDQKAVTAVVSPVTQITNE